MDRAIGDGSRGKKNLSKMDCLRNYIRSNFSDFNSMPRYIFFLQFVGNPPKIVSKKKTKKKSYKFAGEVQKLLIDKTPSYLVTTKGALRREGDCLDKEERVALQVVLYMMVKMCV